MSMYMAGEVVMVKKAGVICHEAIVGHNGVVIHNDPRRGVIVSSWDEFTNGRKVVRSLRYGSPLTRQQIVQNAYARVGAKWRPTYNCQHFVTDALGLDPRSHQMAQAILVALAAVLFISVGRTA